MGIVNGRDTRAETTVVKEGREWRSQAKYELYVSDGKYGGTRLTNHARRPPRRTR